MFLSSWVILALLSHVVLLMSNMTFDWGLNWQQVLQAAMISSFFIMLLSTFLNKVSGSN